MSDNLPPEAAAALLREADRLFDSGDRAGAAPLYAHLAGFGPPTPRVAARHAEALLEAGRAPEALLYLRDAAAKFELDAWGRRALAYAESATGDGGTALTLASAALSERPDDAGFVTTFLDMQQRHGGKDSWREGLGRPALPDMARHELQARLSLAEGRPLDAAALLADAAFAVRDRLYYLALQTGYAVLEAEDVAAADRLAARLDQAGPDELPAILLRTEILLNRQLYDDAAACLRRVPPAHQTSPDVRLKWFELACFTGDVARARHLLVAMEADGALPHQAVPSVLRFFAEQQDWDQVFARALAWLDDSFRFRQIGYVLFRAARRAGRAAELLATVEAVPSWRDQPDLRRLHTALAWVGADNAPAMAQVAAEAHPSPAMRHRMEVQRAVMARARPPGGRRALFLCTDESFLGATLVALHSALEQVEADAFLVVPDALAEMAGGLAAKFRAASYGVSIVPASRIVPNGQNFGAAYGVFTSGLTLAPSAYWRIFFARYLLRQGCYGRALYLDGDVLVRRALAPLFEADLHGHPLGARQEPPRPEVARAIALHGLADNAYFNSGVLLFDLTHAGLGEALDRAAHAATDERVEKMFHDQCALNLGFRDLFAFLPSIWNTAITEQTAPPNLPDDTAILHFLERPKPWSAAYDGPCATLWFDRWAQTAEVIGAEAAITLLEMAGD